MQSVAESYKVTRPRIYQVLLEHAEADWKAAQASVALDKYESAGREIEQAQSMLEFQKAREIGKRAEWILERTLRRIYGQDYAGITLNVNLGDVGAKIERLEQELKLVSPASIGMNSGELSIDSLTLTHTDVSDAEIVQQQSAIQHTQAVD